MTPNYRSASVSDGITWNNQAPNYVLDSCEFIDKFEENLASEEGMTDAQFKAVPDAHLSEATTGYMRPFCYDVLKDLHKYPILIFLVMISTSFYRDLL